MIIKRRISASFKDIPGGQILGPTFDYSHRLLDFSLMKEDEINSYQKINNQEPKNKEFPSFLNKLARDLTNYYYRKLNKKFKVNLFWND